MERDSGGEDKLLRSQASPGQGQGQGQCRSSQSRAGPHTTPAMSFAFGQDFQYPDMAAGPFPTKDWPSDHVMIYTHVII